MYPKPDCGVITLIDTKLSAVVDDPTDTSDGADQDNSSGSDSFSRGSQVITWTGV